MKAALDSQTVLALGGTGGIGFACAGIVTGIGAVPHTPVYRH